jgi:long-chain acyl-CoA synthetase
VTTAAPAPENLADVVRAAARTSGALPAVIGADGTRTWAELDGAVDRGAALLAARHEIGARVLLALPTGADLAAALFAVLRAGLVAVPVDPQRTDLAWVAGRVGAMAAVTDAPPAGVPDVIGSAEIRPWWQPAAPDAAGQTRAGGEDLALLARSARTGPPVMLSHRALLGAATALRDAPRLGVRPEDRVLQVLPLYHVVGLVTAFLPAALAGAAVVVPEPVAGATSAEAALAAVHAHRVSILPAEPTLYRQLDRVPGFERALSTVRLMTSGSSPLDPADFAAVRAGTGQTVWEGYGISESAAAVTSTLMTRAAHPGSVGLPYPGVQVRIQTGAALGAGAGGVGPADEEPAADDKEPDREPVSGSGEPRGADEGGADQGGDEPVGTDEGGDDQGGDGGPPAAPTEAPASTGPADLDTSGLVLSDDDDASDTLVPDGEVGPIEIRGNTLFSGYWPDGHGGPDPDGWYLTGDIGYLDDAGELHLVDRAAETVTVAGFTVYPREVEDVLVTHPYVADAAVVGVPGRGGSTVVAALVAQPGTRPTADDLTEFLTGKLAPFKVPTDYQLVEVLPRTEVGRLDRDSVRRDYAEHRGISLQPAPRLRAAGPPPRPTGPAHTESISGARPGDAPLPSDTERGEDADAQDGRADSRDGKGAAGQAETKPEAAAGLDQLGTKLPSTQSRTRRSAQDSDEDLF